MSNTLTTRQISSHIKKELLKKYPSITKISVTNRKGVVNVSYEGGCNTTEMQKFLYPYEQKIYNSQDEMFNWRSTKINIDGVDYDHNTSFVFCRRSLTNSQAQTVLDLVKEFAEANNQVIDLELSDTLRHGWLLNTPNLSHIKVLIEHPELDYIKTPGLVDMLNSSSDFINCDGQITEHSLFNAIYFNINF